MLKFLIPRGLVETRTINLKSRRVTGRRIVKEYVEVDAGEDEAYFGVAPRDAERRVLPTWTLWADVDFKDTPEAAAREAVALYELKPSVVVASGNGLHCYWRLREPCDDPRGRLRQLARDVLGDVRSAEPAHILRVPGTFNHKYAPPRPVTIEYIDEGAVYDADQFASEIVAVDVAMDDAPGGDAALARGAAYMAEYPPAVEGAGGDAHTFKAACHLVRDLGLSAAAALELLGKWNERCEPPWETRDLSAKVAHARRYGSAPVGRDDPARDFAAVEDPTMMGNDEVPDSLMEKMSKWFLSVDEDGKLRIFTRRHDDILNRKYWVRYTRRDFLEVTKNVMHLPMVASGAVDAKGNPKYVEAGLHWLDSYRKKKTYAGVAFAPEVDGDKTVDGRLNLWQGFAVKPAPGGEWCLLQELVWETLCGGSKHNYDYVLRWLARAVQRPHEPGGVALVFKGAKGTGKSTLGRWFVRLFGQHGMHITSPSLLAGRFNMHLRDVAALFADEAFWAGDKAGEGILKGLVTERVIAYEGKGMNAEMGRNCVHLMMASNEDWVVPAGLDRERRFAVFEVEDDQRDNVFWGRLAEQMAGGGLARMLHDLKAINLDSFDVFRVPKTKALIDQKLMTMEPCEAWLFDLLDGDGWTELPWVNGAVSSEDLQASLQMFCAAHYGRGRTLAVSIDMYLGRMLKKVLPSVKRIRLASAKNSETSPALARRPWGYELPKLEKARREFAKNVGDDPWS